MNEIELNNALKYAELQLTLSTNESKTRFFRTIVQALRAELSRQENAPLTCDGCKRDVPKGEMKYSRCLYCIRAKRPWIFDRYEPKGEKE